MSYPIEIRLASKNGFHTPAEAKAYYGRYSRDGVTIHWWNDPSLVEDSDHDNIVNYLLGKAERGQGSVNYVVSNKKITLVVNARNVAWASQAGNPTTVSIECSPHLNAEGYKKLGWLINELYHLNTGLFKRKPGYWKHSDWNQTSCPGTISIGEIKKSVAKWYDGKWEEPVITPPKPTEPKLTFTLWKEGETRYVTNKRPTKLYSVGTAETWDEVKTVKTFDEGDEIIIVGDVYNSALDRHYYITRYSFDKKLANGFHPADLDVYVPPRPVPKPPENKPLPPTEPTDPTDPPVTELPGWFVTFLAKLIEFFKQFTK